MLQPCDPFGSNSQLARRQVDVVANGQQIGQRHLVEVDHLADAAAGEVHERLRLDEQHLAINFKRFGDLPLEDADWNDPTEGAAASDHRSRRSRHVCRVP